MIYKWNGNGNGWMKKAKNLYTPNEIRSFAKLEWENLEWQVGLNTTTAPPSPTQKQNKGTKAHKHTQRIWRRSIVHNSNNHLESKPIYDWTNTHNTHTHKRKGITNQQCMMSAYVQLFERTNMNYLYNKRREKNTENKLFIFTASDFSVNKLLFQEMQNR